MPYDSRTYRVLIASPSDVEDERETIASVIQEWNDLHSYNQKTVLLPLRWETHMAPQYGNRPQELINREIVDNCDLLVGVFWTRIGTPTGVADGGTPEEIARAAKAGKPVMLYFSNVGMDPDRIDVDQLVRLKKFKETIKPTALIESYKSLGEFRRKLFRQLDLKVRELKARDIAGKPEQLSLTFLPGEGKEASSLVRYDVELPVPADLDDVLRGKESQEAERIRTEAQLRVRERASVSATLQISNTSPSGIQNLFVEMLIAASNSAVEVNEGSTLNRRTTPGTLFSAMSPFSFSSYAPRYMRAAAENGSDEDTLSRAGDKWKVSFAWTALQPQRTRRIRPSFLLWSPADTRVEFTAKVFADSFPAPVILSATADLVVRTVPASVREILDPLASIIRSRQEAVEKAARQWDELTRTAEQP